MAGVITSLLDSARGYAGSIAWSPLVQLCRTSILNLLKGVELGQLTIKEKDGTETICGRADLGRVALPITSLKVVREAFWVRLALFADMVGPLELCCSKVTDRHRVLQRATCSERWIVLT
jgi:hypothetical protein